MNDPTAWYDDGSNANSPISFTYSPSGADYWTYSVTTAIRVAPAWRINLAWYVARVAKWLERKIGGY